MQQNDETNHVVVTIRKKLAQLSPSSSESESKSKCCIFKVHNQLREVNSKAYEPDIVAIGPYHRGKDNLKMMEEHKLRYLRFRLEQKEEKVEIYVNALRELEAEARKYYGETLNLDTNEMIEMMLLDGFFIIELFRKFNMIYLRERDDIIFQMSWIVNRLQRDLMLFENQLPFFVLCKLFDMIEKPNNHRRFIHLATGFFSDLFPGPRHESKYYSDGDQSKKINHLLGLVHDNWLPSYVIEEKATENEKNQPSTWLIYLARRFFRNWLPKSNIKEIATENEKKWRYIQCATNLGEAGITFQKKDDPQSLFDIKFESRVMQIPTLRVEDRTESFFRNLVAYEQYGPHDDSRLNSITDYLKFMDCLINSFIDVTLLCRHGIIDNWLGDDEVVSTLFNKITDLVNLTYEHFHYAKIFEEVNIHCSKRRNQWMANLRRNYLSSPWAIISVLAAFVLLALTITQTVFAIIGK